MRRSIAVAAILICVSAMARAETVHRLSLDDPLSVSPQIEADATVKVEGAGALRITTQWPTTICLGEITGPAIDPAKLIYSARVKTRLAGNGSAFLEMWAHVGGGQYFSRGMNDAIGGQSDWKTIRTPFVFQQGQQPDKLTLNLVINGQGVVWIDDVVLSREPLQ